MIDASRRSVLRLVAATAVVSLVSPVGAASAGIDFEESSLVDAALGIRVGEAFHRDWYVLDAYEPTAGGVTLVVAKGYTGEPVRVDVVRRGGSVIAPAHTDRLDLIVMDGSNGDGVLDPELVEALRALTSGFGDDARQARLARQLLTHDQRLARYPRFMKRAATELAPVPPGGE